jgi:O-antigen ligase
MPHIPAALRGVSVQNGTLIPIDELPMIMRMIFSITKTDKYILFVFILTIFASIGKIDVAGFNIAGWVWVSIILGAMVVIVARSRNRGEHVFLAWLPFLLYIALRTDYTNPEAVQRVAMLTAPILSGYAASLSKYNKLPEKIHQNTFNLFFKLFFILVPIYAIAVIQSGDFEAKNDWFAAPGFSMTIVLISVACISAYSYTRGVKYLLIMSSCLVLSFVSASRNPILIILLLYALSELYYLSLPRRMLLVAVMALVILGVFETAIVQENLFRSGAGTIDDLVGLDPTELKSGGRLSAWPIFVENMPDIWFGGGSASSSAFGRSYFDGNWAHPHNEYIRIVFDYGIVGLLLIVFPFVMMIRKLSVRCDKACPSITLIIIKFGRFGLFAMALLAITGNVLVYVSWYGALLFALIGMACKLISSSTKCDHKRSS